MKVEPIKTAKVEPIKNAPVIANVKCPANPVVKSVVAQDSFDDFMSQINEEEVMGKTENLPPVHDNIVPSVGNGRSGSASRSPVIVSKNAKRRKCFELNLLEQNEASLGQSVAGPLATSTTKNPSNKFSFHTKPAQNNINSSFKRFKSSDDAIVSGSSGNSVRRIQSSPNIPRHGLGPPGQEKNPGKVRQMSGPATKMVQSVCSKEEIDRKRREAMRKRQQSQSQKFQKYS